MPRERHTIVYCWLEPPMVSQKFWNKYPKWREKTAVLKDAKVSWRYLMNFADENCRKKAFSEIESLLMSYDWDGVNVAELYFESPGGPAYPENFTPMNDNIPRSWATSRLPRFRKANPGSGRLTTWPQTSRAGARWRGCARLPAGGLPADPPGAGSGPCHG